LHQETCGGYTNGDGGDEGKNKGAEVDKNIFNNQQGLEAAVEDSGGVARMGGHHDRWQRCTQHVIPEQLCPHPMMRKLRYNDQQMVAATDDGEAAAEDCGDWVEAVMGGDGSSGCGRQRLNDNNNDDLSSNNDNGSSDNKDGNDNNKTTTTTSVALERVV
jgi:hypothetical protein